MDGNVKNTAKMAAGITAGIGTVALGSVAFTRFLMKTAMDRKMPKAAENAEKKIAGENDNDGSYSAAHIAASKRLEFTPSHPVEILAADGTKLVGHWIPSEKPKRIIIAMHGWRSTWHSDFGMVSEFWHSHNCSVLYAEQRGQNNSGGEYMGFGLTERYDCVDWISWALENQGSDLPIYLAGVSMGATTVLMAAGLNLPPAVHGVMADCGFTSPDAIWQHVAVDNLHLAYGLRRRLVDEMFQRRTKEPTDQYSTEESLAHTTVPVLFIHGADDHFVPASMTQDNYQACASPKRILIVPGADHCMSYYVDKDAYERAVIDFWASFDGYTRPQPQTEEAKPSERRRPARDSEEREPFSLPFFKKQKQRETIEGLAIPIPSYL